MAQAETSQPGTHTARFVQKQPITVWFSAIGQDSGRLIKIVLASLVAELPWGACSKTRSAGLTPDWFDIVDPERRWYEDDAPKGHT